MFDSWYASAKLIRRCRDRDWHVICSLKKNRTLNGKQVASIARRSRNKSFRPVWVSSAESSTRYLVRTVTGHINHLAEPVSVTISKRHSGDRSPEYFLCTKINYPVRRVLSHYTWRWAVEVNHLYAKLRLGAEDFRVRSVEGISKHFTLCFLALAYLYWRLGGNRRATRRKLAEIIACHRRENHRAFLEAFAEAVLAAGSVEEALKDFLPAL